MRIIADTSVLIRGVVRDDRVQARAAAKALKEAEIIAISLTTLCEFIWVLDRIYHFARPEIAEALDALLNASNVIVNRSAVEAGLDVFRSGGDFADGLIAYEGNWLGGEIFVSFDKKAVSLIAKQGRKAMLLA